MSHQPAEQQLRQAVVELGRLLGEEQAEVERLRGMANDPEFDPKDVVVSREVWRRQQAEIVRLQRIVIEYEKRLGITEFASAVGGDPE